MRSKILVFLAILSLMMLSVSAIYAQKPCAPNATTTPGFCGDRYDSDGNGITDAGVFVVGKYTAFYAFDATGKYYWDLGDGRVQGVAFEDLDQNTLSTCDYNVQYRADFGNDPFMDDGWIRQHITCSGYAYSSTVQYDFMIVSAIDPRFDPNNPSPGWGPNWRYDTYIISGFGNLIQPERPVRN